jgi:hypothetical protein
MTTNDNDYS